MTSLVATTVVRGKHTSDAEAGVFLIDIDQQRTRQLLNWSDGTSDWSGPDNSHGLGPIAFDDQRVFMAGDQTVFEFDRAFNLIASYRCPYLKNCQAISRYRRRLYMVSSDYDSILGFDLDNNAFRWGLHVTRDRRGLRAAPFNPAAASGPAESSSLAINSLVCNQDAMYLSGAGTRGLHAYTGQYLRKVALLPDGIRNAMPHRDGIVFNDTAKRIVRFVRDTGAQRAFNIPVYNPQHLTHVDSGQPGVVEQAFGRGLCAIDDRRIAAGSSPATITIYDLDAVKTEISMNLSMDLRTAIHGLELWPFASDN
ncbi:MAG: hypothetical protein AAF351_06080 [Pseudomonadota bacterium]